MEQKLLDPQSAEFEPESSWQYRVCAVYGIPLFTRRLSLEPVTQAQPNGNRCLHLPWLGFVGAEATVLWPHDALSEANCLLQAERHGCRPDVSKVNQSPQWPSLLA